MSTLATRSAWTHALCDLCWIKIQLDRGGPEAKLRSPARITPPSREVCCECGEATTSGIYYREHPQQLNCLGEHREESRKEGEEEDDDIQ